MSSQENDLFRRTDQQLRHELRRLWRERVAKADTASTIELLQLQRRADAVRGVLQGRGASRGLCMELFDTVDGSVSLICDEQEGHHDGHHALHYDSFMGMAWQK